MKKNILHIVFNLDSYSGAALQANELRKHFNFPSTILSIESSTHNKNNTAMRTDQIRIYPKKRIWEYIKIVPHIFKASIIHMHGFSLPAMFFSVILGKKIILKTTLLGDDDFRSLRNKKFGWLRGWLTKFIDLNVTLSEEIDRLNKQYLPPEKIMKIPNGVFLDLAVTPIKGPAIFCTVGVISPRKGIANAIQFFNKNYAHAQGAILYVIGPRPTDKDFNLSEGDAEYYKLCKQLASNSAAKVVFTGKLSKPELNQIYARSICFLFFSEKEGMPNVLLEAMSYNCVPITGPISGVATEVIDNKVNGFIIQCTEDKILLEDIVALSMSNAPREKVVKSFDIKSIANKYSDIYENI